MLKQNFKCVVVLATYNGEKYIEDQLKSILNQKKCKTLILVFDDNSIDNTPKILRNFQKKYNNIKVKFRDFNTGSAAHNFMLALSEIKNNNKIFNEFNFFSFSDQDDIWHDCKLFNSINELEKKSLDLYCSDLIKFKNETKVGIIKKSHKIRKYDYLFEGGSAGCTYVFNSKLLNECVTYYNKINFKNWKYFSHDWFVYFIARKNNFKVLIDNNSYLNYRIHDNNVHGDMNTFSIKGILRKFLFFKNNWYQEHSLNYIKLLSKSSDEYKIYNSFINDSVLKKLKVFLKYKFRLRSLKKTILFYVVAILLTKSSSIK